MELNFSLKWNLVNQGGRVPPGVPEQPMTNFGIWLRRLLTGGEANSPYRAQTVHPHLSLTHQIPEIRQPSVPAHMGEIWLLKICCFVEINVLLR